MAIPKHTGPSAIPSPVAISPTPITTRNPRPAPDAMKRANALPSMFDDSSGNDFLHVSLAARTSV
ncbi:MAG: hypothetical protein R3B97_03255 [Dehalococcoidia bacterium]|nr:hypothetical protein [Dehalococcoidia bacterium]MCB9485042.1 hypothetical protein [Thermoflexaceae bacterium]